MSAFELIVAGAFGAVLGSFANVLIYRMPRNESIVTPGSHCPACGRPIRPQDNVPLVSYLVLRGRCRDCGARISMRYPLIEGVMAGLAIAVWAASPTALAGISGVVFTFLLLVITFIDLDHQLILDLLSYPGIVLGLVFAALEGRFAPSALAALGAAALIAGIVVASRGGMGWGDVKLAGMIGAFLGWPGVAVALFAGFMAGGLVGVTLLALRLRGRKDAVPFGPALAAGALIALFWGDAIARWYWP